MLLSILGGLIDDFHVKKAMKLTPISIPIPIPEIWPIGILLWKPSLTRNDACERVADRVFWVPVVQSIFEGDRLDSYQTAGNP
jgi:hypothetical protein